ncbi:MAG: type II toxin-antitoxin system death-on-curing family toxin [Anaerolineae bacterium]|nr:type II toxin-antitoxin system death-on-curing family toxin [Anaerolineae bacterium]
MQTEPVTESIRYPTYSELIFINGKLLNDKAIMTGKVKVRDIDLLLAAEQRPQSSAFGQDAYPTLHEKAAALLHSIARNHPYKDGNKRTATVAALFLLAINGRRIDWEQAEALQRILAVAEGQEDVTSFAAWLRSEEAYPPLPEPELEVDTALIERLIAEQKWLLDELAER